MPNFRALAPIALAAAAVVSIPSFLLAAPPSVPDLTQKIDAAAAKLLADPAAAGLSIAIARNNEIIFAKAYGKADVEVAVAATPDSIFRIGSVTKQFTAAAIMRLVEQGKINLDAEIQVYLPDFPKKQWPVTIRQILTHTSGIWSYTDDDKFMERDASLELTPTELIACFSEKPLDFEPGTQWNYSNSAYYLLGSVIEKVSAKPYAAFVQDEFFTPLKLTHTRYESNSDIIPGRAQGYSFKDGKLANDKSIGADVPGAAGSLLSTATDLCNWEIALSSGKVVSPESYTQMTTPITAGEKPTNYGFGLQINEWEGRKRISHGGGIFGFNSMLLTLPADEKNPDTITVAVLSNSERINSGRFADTVTRYALGLEVFQPKDLDLSESDLARFSGEYAFEGIPLEIRLFARDGKLWAQATGQSESRLLYQGNNEFRPTFDTNVKFVFPAANADSFVLHQRGEITAKRKK
ncbi:MAG: beta-lactamase family protein [Phycisphaerales bacterium]|nr:beta-lactamase family protein [Phycisphaerales bacterium]